LKILSKTSKLDPSAIFKSRLKTFKELLGENLEKLTQCLQPGQQPILFLSVGNRKQRACVVTGSGNQLETAWKSTADKALKYIKKNKLQAEWLKVDIVTQTETISIVDFIQRITEAKTNYFRFGIALDRDFNLAFLEQEVNANAFIKMSTEYKRAYLHEQNMNYYCKMHRGLKGNINFNQVTDITLFKTAGFFFDLKNIYELDSSYLNNGRRKVTKLSKDDVYEIILKSSQYLANQVTKSGRYIYGYFPCFDKEIDFYNILRHASSTYSLIEGYEVTHEESLIQPIKKALEYLEKEGIESFTTDSGDSVAYMIDRANDSEIKLGANAAAILAFAKYTKVFGDDSYLPLMRQLANGIARMQNPDTGQFVHILNYPDLSVKEEFRIIYYDGEAAFALMRLYAIDPDPKWLEIVEKAFDFFIENKYWRHSDHWLSYCSNELTIYRPLDEYFRFGLKNAQNRLDFMLERETTYPTFLELTTAANKMVRKIKELGKHELLKDFDEDKLLKVIHHRAHYQLNGYFYPEIAMYFKNPERILNGFFIRHHSFRCRIDDVEHNISGYCNYLADIL
jgi:hypothetical protein